MTLGYVYDREYNDYPRAYKLVEDITTDKPLLIVDWKVAKELFPEDFSINRFCIRGDIYWTCTPQQDRMVFRENLLRFKNGCIRRQIDSFKYMYYDLMLYDYNDIDFAQYKSVLFTDSIVYLKELKSITGISLKLANHLGFDIFADVEKTNCSKHEIMPEFSHLEGYEVMCF